MEQNTRPRRRRGHPNRWAGLILLGVGALLLARQFGTELPEWLFSWESILILVGIFIGFTTGFRDFGWLIPVGIGTIFLIDDFYPDVSLKRYIWPAIIIGVGLVMLLSPRSRGWRSCRRREQIPPGTPNEFIESNTVRATESNAVTATPTAASTMADSEVLEIVSIFGGIKKLVLSKNLRGGEIVAVFGGAEVNLTQADFYNRIEIEVVQIFGGTKLVVPANWEVRSEAVALFGGIEDKRMPMAPSPDKVLVLKGTTIFGGIEIKSF